MLKKKKSATVERIVRNECEKKGVMMEERKGKFNFFLNPEWKSDPRENWSRKFFQQKNGK